MRRLGSEADRTFRAQKALGEGVGGDFVNALAKGSNRIEELREETRQLNDVLRGESIAAAAESKKAYDALGDSISRTWRAFIGNTALGAKNLRDHPAPGLLMSPLLAALSTDKTVMEDLKKSLGEPPPGIDRFHFTDMPGDLRLQPKLDDWKTEITDYRSEIESVMSKIRTPAEQLQEELKNLNSLNERGIITTGDYARAVTQLQNEFTGVTHAAEGIADSFGSAFEKMVVDGGGWRDALVGFAKDVQRELLRTFAIEPFKKAVLPALTSALGGMFGGGDVGLGSWLPFLSFASGGSFEVGGTGGIDSKLVRFMASPGELVDVRKPGQARDDGPSVVVNVSAPPGSSVERRDRKGTGGGPDIVDVIISTTKQAIGDGTMDGAMGARFGATPVTKRR